MLNKFLLVDDDKDDRDLFQEALRAVDPSIEIHTLESWKDAIPKLKGQKVDPQIIFLDINMPYMNGWECLSDLKSDADLSGIPVVMYSTSPVSMDGGLALSKGAICYLEKPPNFVKLREFLERLAKSSGDDLRVALRNIASLKEHRMIVA